MLDAVTIQTTATPIFDRRSPAHRKWWFLRWPKEAVQTLYIGMDSSVTTANGIPVYPGETVDSQNLYGNGFPADAALFGIVGSAESATLRRMAGK